MIFNPTIGMRVCVAATLPASSWYLREVYQQRQGTIIELLSAMPYPIKVEFDNPSPTMPRTEVFAADELDLLPTTPEEHARYQKQLEEAQDQERRRKYADQYL